MDNTSEAEATTFRVWREVSPLSARMEWNPFSVEVLWEGNDMKELRKKFPLPKEGEIDPLAPSWVSPRAVQTSHWWEKKTPDGWRWCEDPRH